MKILVVSILNRHSGLEAGHTRLLLADDEVKITIIDMSCLQLAPKAEPLLQSAGLGFVLTKSCCYDSPPWPLGKAR